MQNVVIIANPFAGTARGRLSGDEAVRLLKDAGFQAEFRPTDYPGHAIQLARQAALEGLDLVISLGGDGTVHEVAQGLAGTDTPLGVLPTGSGNDFARAVGCLTVEEALVTLRDGFNKPLDTANIDGEFFINSLGILASGLISNRAAKLWRWLGHRRYMLASAATLLSYFGQEVHWKMEHGDKVVMDTTGKYLMAEICNSPFTGGGFRFAPDASMTDGQLDACLIKSIPPWTSMKQLPKAASGKRLDHPAISVSPFTRLEFTVDRRVGYHRDGEAAYLEAGPHVVQIEKNNILVRVPARWSVGNHLEKI